MPSWGSAKPRIYIVGLAPGLHGAGRTGQPFTGDASGDFLFAGLERHGLAFRRRRNWVLDRIRISNAVKCLPPGNAPKAAEVNNCRDYLSAELNHYVLCGRTPRVVLALGGVAFRAVSRSVGLVQPEFFHGAQYALDAQRFLVASFHPSRLNVNTGRINAAMLDDVLKLAMQRAGLG